MIIDALTKNWTSAVERDKFGVEYIDFAKIDLLGMLYRSVFDGDTAANQRARHAAYIRCATMAGVAA